MKKIEVRKWMAKKKNVNGELEEFEDNTLNIVILLTSLTNLDANMHIRIMDAVDAAEKSGVLELEDIEFLKLKNTLKKIVPANWGANEGMAAATKAFLEER